MGIELTAQSNELTLSKINFTSIYQKKVLYAIIDSISPHLKNKLAHIQNINKGLEIKYEKGNIDIDRITYRARDLESLPQNYKHLRLAMKTLRDKSIFITKPNGNEIGTSLILRYEWEERKEIFELSIDMKLFQFLADISKGYSLFQLKTALSLPSIYAMNIYELLAKWRNKPKFFVSIDELRFITNTENKYAVISNFKARVLNTAKKHLDQSDITDLRFNYKDVKEGRSIIGFDIYIVKTNNAFEFQKALNQMSPRWVLSKKIIEVVKRFSIIPKGKTLKIIESYSKYHNDDVSKIIEKINFYGKLAIEKEKMLNEIPAYIIVCLKNEMKK